VHENKQKSLSVAASVTQMCFQQTLKAHTIISTKRNDAGSVFQVRGPTTVQRPANHPAEFWSTARHTGACWRIVVGDWHPAPADIPQIDTTCLALQRLEHQNGQLEISRHDVEQAARAVPLEQVLP